MPQRNAPPDRSQVDGAARPIAETSRPSIIKRTIEFAGSGEFTALEPPKALDREGYADVAGHLGGSGMKRKLRALIAGSRPDAEG